MPSRRKRRPVLAGVLLIAALVLAVRSIRIADVLRWQSVDDQGQSVIKTSFGLRTARLGLGIFYDEAIVSTRDARDVDAALSSMSPGLSYAAETLPDDPSLARRLGIGFDRRVDERPESFTNHVELIVPIWVIAILLAIGPVRWVIAQRRRRRDEAAHRASDDAANAGHVPARSSNMRIAIIALACGIVIGVVATVFIVCCDAPTRSAATTASAPQDDKPPIHPIVGMWRIRIDPIVATYRFANDGSFVLTFQGPSLPHAAPGAAQEAGGTWRVDRDQLVLTNTWSNTPLTIVGEKETATIVSVEAETLELDHLDRKLKGERLTFARAYSFMKGKADIPAIVGRWTSRSYTIDLQGGGDVVIVYPDRPNDPRKGTWSQAGKTLTLRMEPPYVKSAARRAADPSLTQPREELYDVRSVDALRLILHHADTPPTHNLGFDRIEPNQRVTPNPPR